MQGVARVLSGDLDGGDAFLKDAASVAEMTGAHDVAAVALCERSLVATARGEPSKAQFFAQRARTVVRRAGIEECYATPLVCAVHARTALHGGDVSAARRELVTPGSCGLCLLPPWHTSPSRPGSSLPASIWRCPIRRAPDAHAGGG